MAVYSIKDLEQLSGIKAHTIRIWEQRHELFSPQRTDTNIRFYSEEDLKLILNISLLRNHGFKISKIVQMAHAEMYQEIIGLTDDIHSYEDQLNSLTIAMLDTDEELFNSVIKLNVEKVGFEKTMTEIVYPFFRKIGILWLANSINPAQEHFITHLVRQRLMVETDKLKPNADAPSFILFLPEEELHELGLLYANYILRLRGFRTFYLGQTLPIKDVEEIYHSISPRYLLTVLTSKPATSKLQNYVNDLGKRFRTAKVFVTGNQVVANDLQMPENIQVITRFEEFDDITHDLKVSETKQVR